MKGRPPILKTLSSLEPRAIRGKKILMRVDFNLPFHQGMVSDTTRIDRIVPTVQMLKNHAVSRIIFLSHFGRPKGAFDLDYTLEKILPALENVMGEKITLSPHDATPTDDLCLLENLRFDPGEVKNDQAFARLLAQKGDIYINDAFSASHRAHASIDALARLLPAYAGLALEEEWTHLSKALHHPQKPLCVITGGSKISTKLPVLENLCQKADIMVIGGGIANTVLLSQGIQVGRSLCESGMLETAKQLFQQSARQNCQIFLPLDAVIAPSLDAQSAIICDIEAVPSDSMILDIGPKTIVALNKIINGCATVLVNGPLGVFENPVFAKGTKAVFEKIAQQSKEKKLFSIAGGGDSVAALHNFGLKNGFDYVSTAGGAFLEFLEGRPLPGIVALTRKN